MEVVYWIIISIMFIIGFIGLVYPIIPSVIFIVGGIILYGFFFSFEPFGVFFWIVQSFFILTLFFADYIANMIGVKRYGGTKAGVWGSTIGLLVGPFIIPGFGIIVGPFAGAVLAELMIHKKNIIDSLKIGFGSVLGFITGAFAKFIIQAFMIGYFLLIVL